jgi:hypothetical protein
MLADVSNLSILKPWFMGIEPEYALNGAAYNPASVFQVLSFELSAL